MLISGRSDRRSDFQKKLSNSTVMTTSTTENIGINPDDIDLNKPISSYISNTVPVTIPKESKRPNVTAGPGAVVVTNSNPVTAVGATANLFNPPADNLSASLMDSLASFNASLTAETPAPAQNPPADNLSASLMDSLASFNASLTAETPAPVQNLPADNLSASLMDSLASFNASLTAETPAPVDMPAPVAANTIVLKAEPEPEKDNEDYRPYDLVLTYHSISYDDPQFLEKYDAMCARNTGDDQSLLRSTPTELQYIEGNTAEVQALHWWDEENLDGDHGFTRAIPDDLNKRLEDLRIRSLLHSAPPTRENQLAAQEQVASFWENKEEFKPKEPPTDADPKQKAMDILEGIQSAMDSGKFDKDSKEYDDKYPFIALKSFFKNSTHKKVFYQKLCSQEEKDAEFIELFLQCNEFAQEVLQLAPQSYDQPFESGPGANLAAIWNAQPEFRKNLYKYINRLIKRVNVEKEYNFTIQLNAFIHLVEDKTTLFPVITDEIHTNFLMEEYGHLNTNWLKTLLIGDAQAVNTMMRSLKEQSLMELVRDAKIAEQLLASGKGTQNFEIFMEAISKLAITPERQVELKDEAASLILTNLSVARPLLVTTSGLERFTHHCPNFTKMAKEIHDGTHAKLNANTTSIMPVIDYDDTLVPEQTTGDFVENRSDQLIRQGKIDQVTNPENFKQLHTVVNDPHTLPLFATLGLNEARVHAYLRAHGLSNKKLGAFINLARSQSILQQWGLKEAKEEKDVDVLALNFNLGEPDFHFYDKTLKDINQAHPTWGPKCVTNLTAICEELKIEASQIEELVAIDNLENSTKARPGVINAAVSEEYFGTFKNIHILLQLLRRFADKTNEDVVPVWLIDDDKYNISAAKRLNQLIAHARRILKRPIPDVKVYSSIITKGQGFEVLERMLLKIKLEQPGMDPELVKELSPLVEDLPNSHKQSLSSNVLVTHDVSEYDPTKELDVVARLAADEPLPEFDPKRCRQMTAEELKDERARWIPEKCNLTEDEINTLFADYDELEKAIPDLAQLKNPEELEAKALPHIAAIRDALSNNKPAPKIHLLALLAILRQEMFLINHKFAYCDQMLANIICLTSPNHRVLLGMATGSGKTLTSGILNRYLQLTTDESIANIMPSDELAQKNYRELRRYLRNKALFDGDSRNDEASQRQFENTPISFSTISRQQTRRAFHHHYQCNGFGNSKPGYIIADEGDLLFLNFAGQSLLLTAPGELVPYDLIKTAWLFRQENPDSTGEELRQHLIDSNFPQARNDHFMKSLTAEFIKAENMIKGVHYIVHKPEGQEYKIVPMKIITGQPQNNMVYDEVLAAILNLKEKFPPNQARGLSSSFHPTVSFVKEYPHVFGMSGTPGTKVQQQYMLEKYGIKVVNIPPRQESKLKLEKRVVASDHKEQMELILKKALSVAEEKGKSVLIICNNTKKTEFFEKELQYRLNPSNTATESQTTRVQKILGTETEDQFQKLIKRAGVPGTITVATNCGGRGADYRGNMHVIMTDPEEVRVAIQAHGRAARQDDDGSAGDILCRPDLMIAIKKNDPEAHIPENITNDELLALFDASQETAERRMLALNDLVYEVENTVSTLEKIYLSLDLKIRSNYTDNPSLLTLRQAWSYFYTSLIKQARRITQKADPINADRNREALIAEVKQLAANSIQNFWEMHGVHLVTGKSLIDWVKSKPEIPDQAQLLNLLSHANMSLNAPEVKAAVTTEIKIEIPTTPEHVQAQMLDLITQAEQNIALNSEASAEAAKKAYYHVCTLLDKYRNDYGAHSIETSQIYFIYLKLTNVANQLMSKNKLDYTVVEAFKSNYNYVTSEYFTIFENHNPVDQLNTLEEKLAFYKAQFDLLSIFTMKETNTGAWWIHNYMAWLKTHEFELKNLGLYGTEISKIIAYQISIRDLYAATFNHDPNQLADFNRSILMLEAEIPKNLIANTYSAGAAAVSGLGIFAGDDSSNVASRGAGLGLSSDDRVLKLTDTSVDLKPKFENPTGP